MAPVDHTAVRRYGSVRTPTPRVGDSAQRAANDFILRVIYKSLIDGRLFSRNYPFLGPGPTAVVAQHLRHPFVSDTRLASCNLLYHLRTGTCKALWAFVLTSLCKVCVASGATVLTVNSTFGSFVLRLPSHPLPY